MNERNVLLDSGAAETSPSARFVAPVLTVVPKKAGGFLKVKDARGRDIEGLWRRNDRFYAQLSVPGKGCRRVALLEESHDYPTKRPGQTASLVGMITNQSASLESSRVNGCCPRGLSC